MTSTSQAITTRLTRTLKGRTAWDELPQLYTLHLEQGRARLRPWTLEDTGGWGEDPVEGLGQLAMFLAPRLAAMRDGMPPGLHGAAFRGEALQRPSDGGPDRENRFIVAVDRTGCTYSAMQWRDNEQVETWHRRTPPAGIRERIPAALDILVAALLGVPLPPRP
jgi:hypothetical protein